MEQVITQTLTKQIQETKTLLLEAEAAHARTKGQETYGAALNYRRVSILKNLIKELESTLRRIQSR